MEISINHQIDFDGEQLYNKVVEALSKLSGRKISIAFEPLDKISVETIHGKIGRQIESLLIDMKIERQFYHFDGKFSQIENSICHIYNNLSENNVDELIAQLNKVGLCMKGE